jgi:hypothetical protein
VLDIEPIQPQISIQRLWIVCVDARQLQWRAGGNALNSVPKGTSGVKTTLIGINYVVGDFSAMMKY